MKEQQVKSVHVEPRESQIGAHGKLGEQQPEEADAGKTITSPPAGLLTAGPQSLAAKVAKEAEAISE